MNIKTFGCVGAVCLLGSAAEANLAANAGFESRDAKGGAVSWSAGRAWRFERQGTDGSFGAVFENDDPKYYGGVTQQVSVKPGSRYSFGALVKTEKLNGKALMCLEWYGPDGKYVGGTYAPGVGGTTDWTALKGLSKAIPTNAVRVVLQAYCERETVGKAVFDDVWLREVELPLVDGLYSSRYRNAAADGRVTFKAALNLPKGAEATAAGSFAFVDLENPKSVRRLSAKIADGAASVACAVADFALGENRVEFTLSNVSGRKPETLSIAFTRLTAERERALRVRFDEYGRTIVDGQPFFPLGMYWGAVDESKLDVYKEGPFNCLMPYRAPNRAQMDLCAERGLKVIYNLVGRDLADGSAIRRFREHPALLAWYLNDERPISLRKELTEARRCVEAYDPDHPGWIAIFQHDEVRDYLPTFDVVGTDPYPLYRWPIGMVTEWTRDTRKGLMGLKPMWQIPQVFDKGAYPSNRKMPEICKPPTFDDMRNMAWQCLAGGAKGLVFYSFFDLFAMDKTTPFEKRWGEVKRMAEEIRGYVPYFLSTEAAPVVTVDDDRAVAAAWRHDGRDLVVAVNTTRENLCVNVTVGGEVRRVALAPVEVRFLEASPVIDAGCEALDATVYAWRGERRTVWRDQTNRTASAVLVRPTCKEPFVRVGVARPVRGDGDILYADRVEWGGAALVGTGEVVRLVAEIAVPRTGALPASVSVVSPLGTVTCPLAVSARQFPEGAARRTFLDLWQHPWAVARYYRVKPFSKEHYAKMRPLWTRLGEAGQKVVTATIMNRPWAHQCFDGYGSMVRHVKCADGSWTFDYTVFDEYVKFALGCGLGPQIHCYSVCPFRLKRYYWEDEKGHEQFGDFDVGSPEYLAYWEPFLRDFARHLREEGLFDRTYIALDERSPAELRTAYDLVKRCGGFKIAMAGDRCPDQFDGVEIDSFSIALQCVTPPYIASAKARRTAGKTTSVYVAGGNPCTGMAQPLVDCEWLGAYPGAVDLDGFLRWAYCSWPANPNSDATYNPWFGRWSAGGTFLAYPDGPSLRCLALFNGLNLSEKLKILRDEGKVDDALAAVLREFEYKGAKAYRTNPAHDVLRRTEALVHTRSAASESGAGQP